MLTNLMNFLNGKKTYMLAVITIFTTIVSWLNGTTPDNTALQQIVTAMFAVTIRHGISTSATAGDAK